MIKKIIMFVLSLSLLATISANAENNFKLDHLVMTVNNINETIKFYQDDLGVKIRKFGKNNERFALQIGDQKINLHEVHHEFEPKALHPTIGAFDFCIETDVPLKKLIETFKRKHIAIIKELSLHDGAKGPMTSFYIRDPDGNLIEFANYHKEVKVTAVRTTQTIPTDELSGYDKYPPKIKRLVKDSLALASKNLKYEFGSANPKSGGLDCSGVIYYLLEQDQHIKIPRNAEGMYDWLVREKQFHPVNTYELDSQQFSHLRPGDLIFWSGTYRTNHKITHVMLYLGTNKENKPLIFGSSNGRTYNNKRMYGVSVFDFRLPKMTDHAKFVGYGSMPI